MSKVNPKTDAQGDTIGEGNYDASRRYREGVEKSVERGDAERLARTAKEALEGEEGDELRDADERGKKADTGDAQ